MSPVVRLCGYSQEMHTNAISKSTCNLLKMPLGDGLVKFKDLDLTLLIPCLVCGIHSIREVLRRSKNLGGSFLR